MFPFIFKSALLAFVISAFVLFQSCAFAEELDLPPEPAAETPAGESIDLPDEASETDNSESPAPGLENKKPAATVSDTLEKGSAKNVVDGPLQGQRQALYDQIQAAEANGIGIKNYMMAFNYIEDMAAKGESEEAIKKRMVPLVSALASQLKTKQYLKNRPKTQTATSGFPDPNSLLAPNQNIPSQLRKYGGLGGAGTDDLIKKIVADERLKGKIPKGINKNNLKQKLKDPQIQELIKKYKNRF